VFGMAPAGVVSTAIGMGNERGRHAGNG
jgi:hypothetical protein